LDSPKEHWGGPVAWIVQKSTGVADDLVDSKEHWGRPVTWLNPRSTGVAGGLVESKEHWGGRWLG
jgi:hypothetical protein